MKKLDVIMSDMMDCLKLETTNLAKAIKPYVNSLVATDKSVAPMVERKLDYFKQQLGSEEKVVAMYGFDNMNDLKKELGCSLYIVILESYYVNSRQAALFLLD